MNYELTKAYLDLIVTYVSIMILLSRVEDRKAVLGLFNFAYELLHGKAYVSIRHYVLICNTLKTLRVLI